MNVKTLTFKQISTHAVTQKLALAIAFAGLTAVASRIAITLPFTPVPLTLQTFVVLCSGLFLGWKWGGLSQLLFVIFRIGEISFLAAQCGYLVGFIAAAMFLGWAVRFTMKMKYSFMYLILICFAAMIIYYAFGLTYLACWSKIVQHQVPTIVTLFTLGLWPFLIGDVIKLSAAAILYFQINRSKWIARKNTQNN